MKIHEYQSKDILKKFNISVPKGKIGFNKHEIISNANSIGYPNVMKAKIHAGGRGKAGGVKIIR